MSSKSSLAKKVETLRKEQGLSQERLAHLADVSNNTIINIEAGININPTTETLRKIAKALKIPVEELLK